MDLKCHLCGQICSIDEYCPCPLGEHLLTKHPQVQVLYFAAINPKGKRGTSSTKRSRNKSVYKTTVETWMQGPLRIKCPYCKKIDRPCLRKQNNKIATSPIGAFFLLTCWPFCFLPFLISSNTNIDLYCKYCQAYLGQYNRQTGNIDCQCITGDKSIINKSPCSTNLDTQ